MAPQCRNFRDYNRSWRTVTDFVRLISSLAYLLTYLCLRLDAHSAGFRKTVTQLNRSQKLPNAIFCPRLSNSWDRMH